MTEATVRRLLLRVAELERQNADLQAANNQLLQRARNAEDRLKAAVNEANKLVAEEYARELGQIQ